MYSQRAFFKNLVFSQILVFRAFPFELAISKRKALAGNEVELSPRPLRSIGFGDVSDVSTLFDPGHVTQND